ncbi:molybdopterin molybdotransferase MoeA [Kribbella sp. DT2]|uniref:molybdopterin molybdotransferase MoeA n=1 Tax=Kribbella sp. DT2 TaxID=3393427 RepID=UPI003CEA2264
MPRPGHRHAAASLPWDVARELAHAASAALAPRSLPLSAADGTTLATPLVSPGAVPPVDRSAMDGYAVRGEGPWQVVGTILAGSGVVAELQDGQAYAIVTGGSVPAGTTGVLQDELAVLSGDELLGTVVAGQHIRLAGEECAAGEVLLPAGVRIDPSVLGLAAAVGLDRLTVIPKPRVAAFVTGDELVQRGASGPGQVRDAIGPMLPGLIERAGATCTTVTHLNDSRQELLDAIAGCEADVILVSGSSATGPADHLRAGLTALGAELVIDGVACRPGHPQALARFDDGRLVIGLPGNPFAALTAFLTLGVAALHRLRGLPLPTLPVAPIPGGLAGHPTSTRLVPVRVTPEGAVPVGHAGSAMLRGAAAADALAIIEPGPTTAIAARLLSLDPGATPWTF